ncbi:MAG: serine hydrolase domain-containing protein [Bowdeniella nasicola]|nr:serine hydrolase domain-containing protein [Bowdeniella nasicola]
MSKREQLRGTWSFDTALIVTDPSGIIHQEGRVSQRFELASVTKLLSAYGALIAIERGQLSLSDSAGQRAPAGATIRHLLSHASGLPFEQGYLAQKPERHRVYSNLGIEVLGERVAQATGVAFHEYVNREILMPLGISEVTFYGSAAWGAHGSAFGVAKLLHEWMRPTLICQALHRMATTCQFPDLDGVLPGYGRQKHNCWGLGFELRGHKDPHWLGPDHSPRSYGHFGQAGSFVWIDPSVDLGAVFLGAKPYGEEHRAKWSEMNARIRAAFR